MSNEEQAPDVSAAGDAAAGDVSAESAEAEKTVTAAGQDQPAAPGSPAEPPAPAAGEDAEEVEYVYEDEHGNPIAAPEAGLNPDEYEVVETAEGAGEGAPASAAAAAPAAPAAERPAAETKRLAAPSSRRAGDRQSARQPKQMTPEELKKVRVKVFLLLGLIGLIPLLIIAIAVTWYFRHYRPRQRAKLNPVVRVEQNAYEKGAGLFSSASPRYDEANRLYEAGKRAEALKEYRACEEEFDKALKLIEKWRQENPGDYAQVDMTARDIRIKLRNARERMIMLEATPPARSPAPPPAPAPAPAPETPAPAPPSPGEAGTP